MPAADGGMRKEAGDNEVSRATTSSAMTISPCSSSLSPPPTPPSQSQSDLTGFWLLLSGKDVTPTHPLPNGKRARVVMMHGWLMSHSCWLTTATQLRDRYGHDVLLFDFHGHGRSRMLPHYKDNTPAAYVEQLRRLLQHVGWAPRRSHSQATTSADETTTLYDHHHHTRDHDREKRMGSGSGSGISSFDESRRSSKSEEDGLVLCGLSLGGVVSLRYCDAYPSEVARIILVASPGLDERWWIPSTLTYPLRRAVLALADVADAGWLGGDAGRWMVRRFMPLKTFLSHVNLVRDTPTFGVPQDMPQRLKKTGKPLVLVWGLLDQFHTPQLRRWKADRPRAEDVAAADRGGGGGNGGEDKGVHIHVERYWDHFAACMLLDRLELASKPHFWHDAAPPPPPQTKPNSLTAAGGRSRL